VQKVIEKLALIGSHPLGAGTASVHDLSAGESRLLNELLEMLSLKNGFFAFESALHVFPTKSQTNYLDLLRWNMAETWKSEYGDFTEGLYSFAQDIFGVQHCIKGEEIVSFDPETGSTEFLAKSIAEWATKILEDLEFLTGYPIAHQWQSKYGALPIENRLMPKIPFVCGGEFAIGNLVSIEARRSMQLRANFALQLKDIPDGQQFTFKLIE
jgi:hypothetical protein